MSSYLTTKGAAELLGVSDAQVRRLCIAGKFGPKVKWGAAWKIPRAAVLAYQATNPKPGRKRKPSTESGAAIKKEGQIDGTVE